MVPQTECHPDEFGILKLSVDPFGRQTLPELSSGAYNLYRDYNRSIDDWTEEVPQRAGKARGQGEGCSETVQSRLTTKTWKALCELRRAAECRFLPGRIRRDGV